MSRFAIGLCLAILAAGCTKNNTNSQTTYQSNTQLKPVVSIVPLFDNSKAELPWSLSDELTLGVRYRLIQKDRLYLVDDKTTASVVKKLTANNDPFGIDISWMKKVFYNNEFVVFMELMEHQEISVYSSKDYSPAQSPAELNMTVRLRVVDVRGSEPKIALQEMVHDVQYIPRQFNSANFFQVSWGNDSYSISPVGLAHADLIKEVAARVEDYILLSSKSK